ncbi:hypothetical protein CMI40_02455 [Candidatus Pacearchaeota archaeon]|nr:hypothetical protein [Candidatus Pacearchaeota archaeon]|tara:strand:- start:405 stop:1403 length:999 start_codon:yes stop_codon:yes gene_type:complete
MNIEKIGEFENKQNKKENIFNSKIKIYKNIFDIPNYNRLCNKISKLNSKKINIGRRKLYVESKGSGPALVLINGGPGGTHHIFHPHFELASKFSKVIYYDQRGCGLSNKNNRNYTIMQAVDDLDKLRISLKIDKWFVLGHSYGGLLAQYYALKYRKNLLGIILVCSSYGFLKKDKKSKRELKYLTPKEIDRIGEIFKQISEFKISLKQGIYNMMLNGDWKRQNFYKPSKKQMALSSLYEWDHDRDFNKKICKSFYKKSLLGKFNNFKVPTLIIESKWDLTWNSSVKVKIMKSIHPNSRIIIFKHSGHSPFMDEPVLFFNTLKEFILQQNLKK